jgi:transposase
MAKKLMKVTDNRCKLTELDKQHIYQLRQLKGESYQAISFLFDVAESTIYRVCKKMEYDLINGGNK